MKTGDTSPGAVVGATGARDPVLEGRTYIVDEDDDGRTPPVPRMTGRLVVECTGRPVGWPGAPVGTATMGTVTVTVVGAGPHSVHTVTVVV